MFFNKKLNNNCSGFTFAELLAVIFIVGIIVSIGGVFIIGIINNSEDSSNLLTKNSIKQAASVYIEEYADDVVWRENEDKSTSYSCISVLNLVNKGYFNKEEVSKVEDYIIVAKNSDNVIIKAEEDINGMCANLKIKKIEIPTAKKYCRKDLFYSPDVSYNLLENIDGYGESVIFSNNENKIMAGSYQILATLTDKNKYVWSDGTSLEKKFTCSIKRATPYFTLSSLGDDGVVGDTEITLKLTSSVAGKISLKSSHKEFATATVKSFDTISGVATIVIHKLATRKANTYITITMTPDDKDNYYSYSQVYTIGDVEKKIIDPETLTVDNICLNPDYNGSYQFITKPVSLSDGYDIYHNYYKEIGNNYKVFVKLKYGSVWADGTVGDKEFTCSILRPNVVVTYDDNGGNSCDKVKSSPIPYEDLYGNPPCTPSRTGYTLTGWYNSLTDGIKIEPTTKITNWLDHTLYARWTKNQYTLSYNSNNGSACSSKNLYYEDLFGELCVPVRNGYSFKGWYDGSTKVSSSTKIYNDVNLMANWEINQYKFDVNLDYGIESFRIKVGNGSKSDVKTDYFEDNDYGTNFIISDIVAKKGYTKTGNSISNLSYIDGYDNNSSDIIGVILNDAAGVIQLTASPKEYTLTYDSNGGTSCNAKKIIFDDSYGDLCVTSLDGYTFLGWYTEKSGGKKVDSSTVTTGDIKLYAHWRENVWKVSSPEQYQDTLQHALDVVDSSGTITLQKSVTDDSAIYVTKNVTIDLGKHTLTRTKTLQFNSGIKATLKGSGSMQNNTNVNVVVLNYGLLSINNLTFSAVSGNELGNAAIIYNLGQMEIIGANVSSDGRPAIQTGASLDHLHGLTWIKDCVITTTKWHAIRNFSVARWPIESEYKAEKHLRHCSQKCAVHIEGTTKISQPDASNSKYYPVMNEYGKIHMPKAYVGWIYSKDYYTLRSASVHTFDADFSLYDISIHKKNDKSTGTIKMNGGTLYAKKKGIYRKYDCDSSCNPGVIEFYENTKDEEGYVKKKTGTPPELK